MASETHGSILLSTADKVSRTIMKKTGSQTGYKPSEWADEVNLMGLLPIRTASGSIAHFEDGADDVPLKSLTAQIVPIQEGTGDPSPTNKRPISGTSVLNVTRTGANIFDKKPYTDWEAKSPYKVLNTDLPKNALLTMVFLDKDTSVDISGCYLGFVKDTYNGGTVQNTDFHWTLQNGTVRARTDNVAEVGTDFLSNLLMYPTDEATYNKIFSRFDIMIVVGSEMPSTYEPYTGSTYTIALGRTVYGGTYNSETGVLTLTYGSVDLGSRTWTYHPASGQYNDYFDCNLPTDSISGTSGVAFDGYCSIYKSIKSADIAKSGYDNNVMALAQGTRRFIVCDQRFTDKDDFVAGITGVALIYPLLTPIEIQLTPTEINSLLGVNNIWHDGNGDTEVEYRADMNLLIASLEGNRGLQMMRATPTEENDEQEVEENEDER